MYIYFNFIKLTTKFWNWLIISGHNLHQITGKILIKCTIKFTFHLNKSGRYDKMLIQGGHGTKWPKIKLKEIEKIQNISKILDIYQNTR